MKQDVDAILSEATKAYKEMVKDVEKTPLIRLKMAKTCSVPFKILSSVFLRKLHF